MKEFCEGTLNLVFLKYKIVKIETHRGSKEITKHRRQKITIIKKRGKENEEMIHKRRWKWEIKLNHE